MMIKTIAMISAMIFSAVAAEGQVYTPTTLTNQHNIDRLEGCNPRAEKCFARSDFNYNLEEEQTKPKKKPVRDQKKHETEEAEANNKILFGQWDPTFYHRYAPSTTPPSQYGSNSHEGMLRGGGGDPSYPGSGGTNPSSVGTVDSYRR